MFNRLETAFQREKQFTSDVSHELRTPLSIILAQSELALEISETEEDYREALEVINAQGSIMNDLITQLLFFSRAEQGRQPLNITEFNLSELIKQKCSQFTSNKNITLNLDISKDIHACLDSVLIGRIIVNLINNAEQYGKVDGHIDVSLTCEDDIIRITISDDGIGIPEEHLNKIWDRFYQVDPSRTSSSAGLGLSMVKEIVKLHNGTINVTSTVGKGSTFVINLPITLKNFPV